MEIIIKEDNLTVSHKLDSEWPNEVSPAEAMLAAYDVLSRIFGQAAVIDREAYTNRGYSRIMNKVGNKR